MSAPRISIPDCLSLRAVGLAAAGFGATLASLAGANVTVKQWNGPTSFHHKRIGVPDQDQKRVGLPNTGNCYCVPTSMMNLLMYVANHGYPSVVPGPGNYSGYDTYYEVTGLLEDLGGWAGISPGGPDPNDPDCLADDGGGDGGDGCSSLPCGGKSSKVYQALVDHGWLGAAEGQLVWTSRYHDQNAPPANFQTFADLAFDGQVLVVSFGRYKPVGGSGSNTIYRRDGGHQVTMNEIRRDGGLKDLYIRDPGNDNDIFGPSPYATTKWKITDITIQVTQDAPGGLLLSWWPATFSAINEPQSGTRSCLDGYMAVAPKTGVFWKDYIGVTKLPLAIGFGGEPLPHPVPLVPLLDLAIDHNNLGWFAIAGGTEVSAPAVVHLNPISGEATPLFETAASRLALGNRSELFSIETAPPKLLKHDLVGTALGSAAIPGLPSALAYDDATERVLVFVPPTAGPGGSILEFVRNFEAPGASGPTTWLLPSSVMPGTACRMAVEPGNGRIWIASENQDKAFGFDRPSGGPTLVLAETVGGFAQLTSVEFDDIGRMYAVDGGQARVFERGAAGGWQEAGAGPLAGQDVGQVLRIARSRTNYDPAVVETSMWDDLPGEELEEMGEIIPDCLGDLNGDGVVDGADLGIMLGAWGGNGVPDLNTDGQVNGADLGILLGAWGACRR